MTEIHDPTKKIRKTLFSGIFFALALGIGIFFAFGSCSNVSPDVATLALKKDGKVYLYAAGSSEWVDASLAKKESPASMAFVQVHKDDDKHYLTPLLMAKVVQAMAGDTKLHNYKEKSYDGYFTANDNLAFDIKTRQESTEVIGEQLTISEMTVKNEDGEELPISWSFNPKQNEYKAYKNCLVKSFWFETNPSPGETVISSKDFLVVNLHGLCSFFKCSYEYDSDHQVLYIIK